MDLTWIINPKLTAANINLGDHLVLVNGEVVAGLGVDAAFEALGGTDEVDIGVQTKGSFNVRHVKLTPFSISQQTAPEEPTPTRAKTSESVELPPTSRTHESNHNLTFRTALSMDDSSQERQVQMLRLEQTELQQAIQRARDEKERLSTLLLSQDELHSTATSLEAECKPLQEKLRTVEIPETSEVSRHGLTARSTREEAEEPPPGVSADTTADEGSLQKVVAKMEAVLETFKLN